MRNDKAGCNCRLRAPFSPLPVENLRVDIVKHRLLSIKHLAWSWVFYSNSIASGLYSEVLTHLSLWSTLVFIEVA